MPSTRGSWLRGKDSTRGIWRLPSASTRGSCARARGSGPGASEGLARSRQAVEMACGLASTATCAASASVGVGAHNGRSARSRGASAGRDTSVKAGPTSLGPATRWGGATFVRRRRSGAMAGRSGTGTRAAEARRSRGGPNRGHPKAAWRAVVLSYSISGKGNCS